jgi:hypothetical protein
MTSLEPIMRQAKEIRGLLNIFNEINAPNQDNPA